MFISFFIELNDKKAVQLTRLTDAPTGISADCYYYPAYGIAAVQIYVPERESKTYNVNEAYSLMSVPDGYRPKTPAALSCYASGTSVATCVVNTSGLVRYMPKSSDTNANSVIYVTGFWFVE